MVQLLLSHQCGLHGHFEPMPNDTCFGIRFFRGERYFQKVCLEHFDKSMFQTGISLTATRNANFLNKGAFPIVKSNVFDNQNNYFVNR